MPVYYTTTLSDTIVKNELDNLFDDVIDGLFGNITGIDFRENAGIEIKKLAGSFQEMVITIDADEWGAANAIIAATPLPGSGGDMNWVATDAQWICTDTGDGTGTFNIVYGAYNSSGTWVTATTIASAVALPNAAGADDANDGRALEGGSVSLVFDTTEIPTAPNSIAIQVNAAGANVLSATTGFLTVSVTLKRLLQP